MPHTPTFRTFMSALLISLCLSACHPHPAGDAPEDSNVSWSSQQNALSNIQSWRIKGSFSVQTPKRNVIGSYQWNQQGRSYQITLISPMGALSVTLSGAPGKVTLWRNYKPENTQSSPEKLLNQYVGWSLPISNLYYWVRGLPAPGVYKLTLTDQNQLNTLDQNGWHITFSDYKTTRNGLSLPRTLQLQRSQFASKMTIKQWALSD